MYGVCGCGQADPEEGELGRTRVRVRGLVQGVGFRPFVHRLAARHGLTGWVRNDEEGVLIEVQGCAREAFLADLARERPPLSRIDALEAERVDEVACDRPFFIDASARVLADGATAAIGPDHAPCRACLEELFDPAARRYLYPFLNCTNCGPRYTLTRGLPYDRPQTSMAPFAMCEDCAREYHDPRDRRFHAQPIACPACGPRLSMPLPEIARRLREGQILALKGAGGFLLACDARDDRAVSALRERKQRDAKPFAVMVSCLASAQVLADLTREDMELLQTSRRPIVVVRRRPDDGLSPRLCPGLAWLGLMLPSTPLHYAIFHALAGALETPEERPQGRKERKGQKDEISDPLRPLRPCGPSGSGIGLPDVVLVMTSANPGGEPLVINDAEAATRLAGIADAVVTHGRAVVVRNDDSVTRVVAGAPTFLRRARGYVPDPVRLPVEVPPVVAVGGHLKATVCFTRGREAFVSQHVGDLDDAATRRFFGETLLHLRRTLEVTPVAVAHDLHPDFFSTREAEGMGLRTVPVQHHHAHVAAVMAEHGARAAVGLALDGYGYGSDGGAWGGELLAVDGARFERVGHLRPLRLPGGDAAARAPWRMASAALHALGRAGEILPRFAPLGAGPLLLEMLARGVQAPWTTSLGRYFDAAAGLLGVRLVASYEGEAAMALESLVTRPEVLPGTWRVEGGVLDLLPLLDALPGRPQGNGADVFHGTLAAALVDWASPALGARGLDTVVLGGGCVMNKVLAELVVGGFARRGVTALLPRAVPANDGGLSLGQAWVAALALMG
jgi:hydrogenase maturation protein HypF